MLSVSPSVLKPTEGWLAKEAWALPREGPMRGTLEVDPGDGNAFVGRGRGIPKEGNVMPNH